MKVDPGGIGLLDPPAGGVPAGGAPAPGSPPQGGSEPAGAPPGEPAAPPEWLTQFQFSKEREALKGDKTLARYKSAEDALAALPEQMKAIGELRGAKFPGEDAKPEERRAFWTKLGVPETVDGYKDVKIPAVEGVHLSEAGVKTFFEQVGLKEGYTPRQAQAAVNFLAEYQAQQRRDLVAGWINEQEALRQEWGMNFDREITLAKRGMQYALEHSKAGDGLREALTAIEEHPGLIRLAAWIGRNLAEDGIVPGHPEGVNTDAEMDARQRDIDAKFFAATPGSPEYNRLRLERENFYKARYGTEKYEPA
jgi:hypothetical protein